MLAPWHTRLALLTLALATCAVAADNSNRVPEATTYRSTVSEVRVTFFATDESNRPVTSLTGSDFAVVDGERIVRSFRSFTHSDETSLLVVVLVDVSQSVAPRLQHAVGDVVHLVAQEQTIQQDELSVLSFGGASHRPLGGKAATFSADLRPAVLCSSGCGSADSMNGLLAASGGGATPLFDSLIFSADFISHHRRSGVRPVVILFSDGCDTISLHSSGDALRALATEGTLVYSVDLGGSDNQITGGQFLQQISNATGGRYFSPRFSQKEDAAAVLNAVLEDLHASYVVTYDLPSHQPGSHALRLMPTHNLKLTFHSRNAYDYEPGLRESKTAE